MNHQRCTIQSRKSLLKPIVLITTLLLFFSMLAGCSAFTGSKDTGDATAPVSPTASAPAPSAPTAAPGATPVKNRDLVIAVKDISKTAQFYPVEVEGVKLEVIAVKAPDGTIRTAFNTCQVCYDSGQGYYKQQGNELVCQNCGNRFTMDEVEVLSGGCNPVPIFPEDKTVTDQTITIPLAFLKEAKTIFSHWRSDY